MSDTTQEEKKVIGYTINSLPRGQYIIAKENKYCLFQFPIDHSLENNLEVLKTLTEEIEKTIVVQNEKAKEELQKKDEDKPILKESNKK